MKCRYCGHDIPDDMLYCEVCGKEVRIVPDYNPLDDMLTEQIRGSIDGRDEGDYLNYGTSHFRNSGPKGRTGRTNASRGNTRRTRSGNTGNLTREERRRQAEKKKARLRKKRRRLLLIMALCIAAVAGLSVLLYQNSYAGIVKKGVKKVQSQEYAAAEEYFKKAIAKAPERAEAYEELSQSYMEQGDSNNAEAVFTDAIEKYPDSAELYEACIKFYLNNDDVFQIPLLLDDAKDSVLEAVSKYVVSRPEFSLDADEPYDDVQQLELSSDGLLIYYTTDGSDPTLDSTQYTEPIQIGEGETTVKAICVNKDGVPSMTVERIYEVELPLEEAPAVSPSTGQYEGEETIEIKVPEGYEAYYTTDGSDPTTASKKYTGPIDMPEGDTLFKAVLVNGSGRLSGITTRNYTREAADSAS